LESESGASTTPTGRSIDARAVCGKVISGSLTNAVMRVSPAGASFAWPGISTPGVGWPAGNGYNLIVPPSLSFKISQTFRQYNAIVFIALQRVFIETARSVFLKRRMD
jgi:hypothetical protein